MSRSLSKARQRPHDEARDAGATEHGPELVPESVVAPELAEGPFEVWAGPWEFWPRPGEVVEETVGVEVTGAVVEVSLSDYLSIPPERRAR
jgi:hypothetical protein